jgi:FdhD protein
MKPPEAPEWRELETLRFGGQRLEPALDAVVREEPLEIRLRAGGQERPVAVTMRTPGRDADLVLGFLAAEGILAHPRDLVRCFELEDAWAEPGRSSQVWIVELSAAALPDLGGLERHFFASSACGVCGRAAVAQLRERLGGAPPAPLQVPAATLLELPARLAARQSVFGRTGGLHAAALFDVRGELLDVAEDVGRHNAVDKLVGRAFVEERLPLASVGLVVSGRAGFEIVQKAAAAGVAWVVAVSAPSTLAVELARELGLTLVGFLRPGRFNVYAGAQRLEHF